VAVVPGVFLNHVHQHLAEGDGLVAVPAGEVQTGGLGHEAFGEGDFAAPGLPGLGDDLGVGHRAVEVSTAQRQDGSSESRGRHDDAGALRVEGAGGSAEDCCVVGADCVVWPVDAEPDVGADVDAVVGGLVDGDSAADDDAVVGGLVDGDSAADDEDGDDGADEDGDGDEDDDDEEGDELAGDGEVEGHLLEPLGETHGDGDFGDGERGVGDETLTDGKGSGRAGGRVFWSWRPWSPRCRAIHSSLCGSKMMNTLMIVVEGTTTTTFCFRYDGHDLPIGLGVVFCWTGSRTGLPHAQRTRGVPWESTRTAVPAWKTAW